MTIELEILVLAGVAIGVICGIIGYWWASANLRRAAGGKSVEELTTEKEQYEAEVVEHFKASADLLNEMTDKYRDVYRHMAEGAQKLVPGDNVAPALAALQSGLLAAPGEPPREAVLEPESVEENPAEETAVHTNGDVEVAADEADVTSSDPDEVLSDKDAVPAQLAEDEGDENTSPNEASDKDEPKGFFSNEPNISADEPQGPASSTGDSLEKPS